MNVWLLDGNILFALLFSGHESHRLVSNWAETEQNALFATCPITEGTLLRLYTMLVPRARVADAWAALRDFHAHPQQVFWPDNFSYTEIDHSRLTGHRQITDAWLAELARRKGGRVITLDAGFAAAHPDAVTLAPAH